MTQQLKVNRLVDFTGARQIGVGTIGDYPGQTILYVDDDFGSDTYAGTHPDYPKATITSAIDAARDASTGAGDWIFVLSYADYTPPTAEDFPISVDKQRLTISGLPQSGGIMHNGTAVTSDEQNYAAFQIDEHWVTIQHLMLDVDDAGSTGGTVEAGSSVFGFTLRGCWLNPIYTATYGFYTGAANDVPNLLIEDCVFGTYNAATATNHIRLFNATRGLIRNNLFLGSSSYCIYALATCGNCSILNNRFKLYADTDGFAIYCADGSSNIYIDGNNAAHGMSTITNDPFWDANNDDSNDWGLNYENQAATSGIAA